MSLRAIVMLSLFLSSGIARGASIKGVVMSYEQSKGVWVAHVTNVSHKNIVCVNIAVTEYSESGSYYSPSEPELDMSRWSNRFPRRGGETFPPGATKDIRLGADASESVTPVVDLVIYADDTAEVVNERALKQYILPIEEKILTLRKENEIILQFASSPNRVADTVAELLRVASDLPDPHMRHDQDAHVNSEELLAFARELKQGRINPATGENEKIDLDDAAKENVDEIEIETKHAHVTRITGAP